MIFYVFLGMYDLGRSGRKILSIRLRKKFCKMKIALYETLPNKEK